MSCSQDILLSTFSPAFEEVLPVLSACWIESLSEFMGAYAVWGRLGLLEKSLFGLQATGALGLLDDEPPLDSTEEWESYKACWSEDASRAPIPPRVEFTPRDPAKREPYSVSTPLPLEYRLEFPDVPVRDQKDTNWCAAHAVASAIEYRVGKPIDASTTKKLFDESRSRDGFGADGTILSATLTTARELGLWQGERVLEPGAVALWKATLVGIDGAAPSPIIAAFATFPSWRYSKACRLSGKWTLPVPKEPCVGLHAALVVGYQDDPSAPGGGFFIVRNSWGEGYACESPCKAPGCALVPYGYVLRYCTEAYAASSEASDDFETKFVRVLEEDARDVDYGGVRQGTKVVAHPNEPGAFRVDSPETRALFIANGYAWTPQQLLLNYFPQVDAETTRQIEARTRASQAFANGLKRNLDAFVGTESPFSPGNVFTSAKRFSSVEEIDDLSDAVRSKLARLNGLPNGIDPNDAPREWQGAIQASAIAKVWRVEDGGRKAFAVVGIWLAPLRFAPLRSPKFEAPTAETLQVAFEVVDEWKARSQSNFETICESFGSFDAPWDGLDGVVRSGHYVLSTFDPNDRGGRWNSISCETFTDERMRGLVPSLTPRAFEDVVSYVRTVLERESRVFFGDFTVELVALKSGLAKSEVESALDELVKNGKYKAYQTARGVKAYRKKS